MTIVEKEPLIVSHKNIKNAKNLNTTKVYSVNNLEINIIEQ